MKKEILGMLTFLDYFVGGTSIPFGIYMTFSSPWIGWGFIVFGIWTLSHLYYLVWGVEEVLKNE